MLAIHRRWKMNIQGTILRFAFLHLIMMSLVVSCSSNKALKNPVKEVNICAAEKCKPVTQTYSSEQLLSNFEDLIKRNETHEIPICSADAKTHRCTSEKVCYFVLGGLLPGNGCADNLTFNEVTKGQATNQINMKTVMPLSFISTRVSCDAAVTTLSVKTVNEISIELEPYHCSWMVMGQMKAKFSFFVDWIDKEHGQIGGYWNHSVTGTGNGSGSGYAILKFPNNLPLH